MTQFEHDNIASWHRRLCPVTEQLILSGDLPAQPDRAATALQEWRAAGITDVIDLREEWSDQDFVTQNAPEMRYHYVGTHDDGTSQSAQWFREGIAVYRNAREHRGAKVLVHCHMGVNRGPSMAYACLVDEGFDPIEALDMIRQARPIAGIIYAHDAIRALASELTDRGYDLTRVHEDVRTWFAENDIDIATIIRRIREAT